MADPEIIRVLEESEEWEEWNGQGSFFHHCLAGSAAGVAEHVLMFPFDTYKTHIQFQRGSLGLPTFWQMMRREGFRRLWRGAPAMVTACIPSHAAYFSAYEFGKEALGANQPGHHPIAAAGAGAMATLLHDAVLTPMDVVKQRLQLGYYRGMLHCLKSMLREEGVAGLYRSYPTTVLMNIPYAAVVVSSNESLKKMMMTGPDAPGLATILLAGAGSGAIAAAVTCPLDVIKTRLQTASLHASPPPPSSSSGRGPAAAAAGVSGGGVAGSSTAAGGSAPGSASAASRGSSSCSGGMGVGGDGAPGRGVGGVSKFGGKGGGFFSAASGLLRGGPQVALLYTTPLRRVGALELARGILAEEGARAFFKGVQARMMVHTPSMAISWGTYETVKAFLGRRFPVHGGEA